MRRTIRPYKRKNIQKQDIVLDILEEKGALFVNIKISYLSDYKFPKKAQIYLEAYNALNIDEIDLGDIGSFEPRVIKRRLPSFQALQRSKIKFRLKIVDTKTWRLLGLAEKLKERKYANSLLSVDSKEDMDTIFKVDWGDTDHPVLYLNQKLRESLEDIKPVLVTAVFKEILLTLLLNKELVEDLEEHKWIRFAKKYKIPNFNWSSGEMEEKKEWVDDVLNEFSRKTQTIKNLKKRLEKK